MKDIPVAARLGATLGEGPVWDAERSCLWFVDIKGKKLHRFDPETGALASTDAPGEIGWALPADNGRLLCGLQTGLHWFDTGTRAFTFWRAVEPDLPGNRLNDACTDAQGRVWFGSMDNSEAGATGWFYRLDAGQIDRVGPGPVSITNGPAVSPGGDRIYFTDTVGRRIWQAALHEDGSLGDARPYLTFTGDEGYPDGSITDAEGNVWVGFFAGHGARRFDPAGREIEFVRLPVANVTKLAFGGEGLKTLYATTAAKGLSAEQRAAQPHAGDLFAFEADTPGHALAPAHVA
ncbi:SMP-30/gluconolactonase/LRE family protein [Sphingomonas suaedae]|uniref:SMP-30/gluconolactonase/LRE family protein n=1 Tax=Sphingomonas suaedae TaxID=2599297 RepID=A0A518RLC0_9SPHN|nr:SMP-30/gluconolactonase/LRE family protein [Sphingomonas suaedae]QDX28243.1 SMP-30/gluconolactonase/LRE family protein [Sphingomonas suaedae]